MGVQGSVEVLASVFLGFLFYSFGFGRFIDSVLIEKVPLYERFGNPRRMIWIDPAGGRLAGQVLTVGESDFNLLDFKRRHWVVEPIGIGGFYPQEGELVRMIGRQLNDGRFEAEVILPFNGNEKKPCLQNGSNAGFCSSRR